MRPVDRSPSNDRQIRFGMILNLNWAKMWLTIKYPSNKLGHGATGKVPSYQIRNQSLPILFEQFNLALCLFNRGSQSSSLSFDLLDNRKLLFEWRAWNPNRHQLILREFRLSRTSEPGLVTTISWTSGRIVVSRDNNDCLFAEGSSAHPASAVNTAKMNVIFFITTVLISEEFDLKQKLI